VGIGPTPENRLLIGQMVFAHLLVLQVKKSKSPPRGGSDKVNRSTKFDVSAFEVKSDYQRILSVCVSVSSVFYLGTGRILSRHDDICVLILDAELLSYILIMSTTCSASKPSLWSACTLRSFTFSSLV